MYFVYNTYLYKFEVMITLNVKDKVLINGCQKKAVIYFKRQKFKPDNYMHPQVLCIYKH